MMWDYDSLIGKASTYFDRAREVADADDDAFALWLLLGLEFLLRAPLARVSPALLADPNGESIMHAVGFPGPRATEPKSIQAKTVILRLGHIVDGFTTDRQDEASILTALRNSELHTGNAALATVETVQWLPRFTRVVEVLASHLGIDPSDLIGSDILEHGRALVDAEDKKLEHDIATRIAAAKRFAEQLIDTEVAARRSISIVSASTPFEPVACPACDSSAALELKPIRTTNEQLVDEEIVRDVIFVSNRLECPVCGLVLTSNGEIKCAGLPQQITRTESESFEDRYLSYVEDDYGND